MITDIPVYMTYINTQLTQFLHSIFADDGRRHNGDYNARLYAHFSL